MMFPASAPVRRDQQHIGPVTVRRQTRVTDHPRAEHRLAGFLRIRYRLAYTRRPEATMGANASSVYRSGWLVQRSVVSIPTNIGIVACVVPIQIEIVETTVV